MPAKLSIQFQQQGIKDEDVLQRAKSFGQIEAARYYKVSWYAFRKYLEEKTGNADYGISHTFSGNPEIDADDVVEKFLQNNAKLRARLTELEREITLLKEENQAFKDRKNLSQKMLVEKMSLALNQSDAR